MELLKPFIMPPSHMLKKEKIPSLIWKRLESHPIYFPGDLVDMTLKDSQGFFLKQMQMIEANYHKREDVAKRWGGIKSFYFQVLSRLLNLNT
jgi:hypothetical protein